MKKVILNLAVSLDSYIEGPNGEYDWCFADQDYGMTNFFEGIDIIFMGRKTYELISSSGDINAFPQVKYIFSDTLDLLLHPDVQIIRRADLKEKVTEIRNETGGDIWLFGGSEIISSFIKDDLINEFWLSVHPIVLGGGKPLFDQLSNRVELLHIGTETYNSGLVQLRYMLKPKFDYNILAGQSTYIPDL